MSNACFLEFYEVIQHYFAEGPLVIAKLGVSVFQIDGFRFLELVLEEVSVRQSVLIMVALAGESFRGFERRRNRLAGFAIQELIPG
jgi:hypothetical protein